MNQYYNKRRAKLQELAKTLNNKHMTNRICRLTERRNNKVADFLHKASKKIIDLALADNIGTIVIGNNSGWKQECPLGHRNNQNFVSIPYKSFIDKLIYKAELVGIKVLVVNESYTSGTSYVDNEQPVKANYDKTRRVHRGLFVSNNGTTINADVNGSYQILKKIDLKLTYKGPESISMLKVA